jgi:hypothetical protein
MYWFLWKFGSFKAPSWQWLHGSLIYYYLCNQCLSPLMLWVWISIRAWCTTLCDKVCQWLPTGRWFSPGPQVSSTNKTDRRDIAEIMLKVASLTFIYLVYPMLPVSLNCPFLIAPSVFSNVDLSCVPYVASFYGLSIFDCPFGIL